ncbi:MAG: LytTR family transcriptional regulator [Chitinophagaceae bacterium]|nr:LytTR family transcriptional regulator [Chitinophagaceae bacterium]
MKHMETINVSYASYPNGATTPILVLPTCKGTIVIPVQHIIRIQSISNYSKLFFSNGKSLVVAKVLHWFEEQSCLYSFVRIHRTHFINTGHIKSYSRGKTGLLFLHNGEIISVAKRKKAGITQRLNNLNNSFVAESNSSSMIGTKKNLAT